MKNALICLAGLALAGAASADIVINEIMYNPIESGTDINEYIELYNTGGSDVNMGGWSFTQGVDHVFPDPTIVPAGGYLVIGVDAAAIMSTYGLTGVLQWTSGALSNGGEDIELVDGSLAVIDVVDYDDGGDWTGDPDGNGPSLELKNPALDNNDGSNWAASSGNGTPGAQNSAFEALGGPPVIVSVIQDPELVNPAEAVTVTATVVDESMVFGVTLEYTVDAGPLQSQPMILMSGDDFESVIPGQVAGSVVEYRVTATDDDAESASSDWYSYTVFSGTLDIVINEIMYNPAGEDVLEFLELYNNGSTTVDLEGWYFDGFTFTFPAGAAIAPGAFLVLAVDESEFENAFGFLPDYEWDSGALSNGGEELVLNTAGGAQVDAVEYDDGGDWPGEADGDGPSLELIDPALDNALASSWQISYVDGGTPAAPNSSPTADARDLPRAFALQAPVPNPFNPATTLAFTLPETGAVSLAVYDLQGRLVSQLIDGMLAGGEHEAVFHAAGRPSGLYIARLQTESGHSARKMMLVK